MLVFVEVTNFIISQNDYVIEFWYLLRYSTSTDSQKWTHTDRLSKCLHRGYTEIKHTVSGVQNNEDNNSTCWRDYEALRDVGTFFSGNQILVHHEIWVNKRQGNKPAGIYLFSLQTGTGCWVLFKYEISTVVRLVFLKRSFHTYWSF